MSVILYINSHQIDLEPKSVIALTMQVNDLNSIETRNSNYTNRFKVPKTANNVKVLGFLSMPGNLSNVPYQKNECSLYSTTGECIVYNGWATIADDGDMYEVFIIDGIIDLYKAIENNTLADLGLAQLTHDKNVNSVITSWSGIAPYIYILADYNGDTGAVNLPGVPVVNTDYLIPAVRAEYLWQQIFIKYGIGYSGAIFQTPEFKNLFMTYPKGVNAIESEALLFESDDYQFQSAVSITNESQLNKYYAKYLSTLVYEGITDNSQIHLKVSEAGSYRIEVTGNLRTRFFFATNASFPADARVYAVKNAVGINPLLAQQIGGDIVANAETETEFTGNRVVNLEANDYVSVVISPVDLNPGTGQTFWIDPNGNNNLTVRLYKIEQGNVDFANSLADFSIRDFVTEIVQRFGLTIFKEKYPDVSGNYLYHFKTLEEQITLADKVDWSRKFIKKINENYIYGSYAQRNWFRYNYNDKESSHNDWYIDVNNKNLEDSKDFIKSKIYSPENYKSTYLNRETNIYKLWEKEVVENPADGQPPVNYNPLDSRYYFIRAEEKNQNIIVQSKALEQTNIASHFYIESFYKLSFQDIIQDYYGPLKLIFDRALIVTVDLWLSEIDIANFDFRKLYYIEQLSNYFLVNKINNYVPGRPTKCDLIKVPLFIPKPDIQITQVQITGSNILVFFDLNIDVDSITFQYSNNLNSWSSEVFPANNSQLTYSLPNSTSWYIRIKAGSKHSNIVQLQIPSNTIITV